MKPEVGKSIDYSELPPVPEGMYECVIKSYKLVDNPYYHPNPYTSDKPRTVRNKVYQPGDVIPADPEWMKKQYQFVFEIVEGEFAGRWLFKRTGTMLTSNERNHLYKLFSKVVPVDLLKSMINDGDAPDIDDDIVGQPIVVVTEIVEGKKGLTNKVTSFMRSNREPSNSEVEPEDEVVVLESIDDLKNEDEIPF